MEKSPFKLDTRLQSFSPVWPGRVCALEIAWAEYKIRTTARSFFILITVESIGATI